MRQKYESSNQSQVVERSWDLLEFMPFGTLTVGPALDQMSLTGEIAGGMLCITWSMVGGTSEYWVYGTSNFPFFEPGYAPGYDFRLVILPSETTTWSSSAGVGDPSANWTYLVMAVDEAETELARSSRVGEHDFDCEIP